MKHWRHAAMPHSHAPGLIALGELRRIAGAAEFLEESASALLVIEREGSRELRPARDGDSEAGAILECGHADS
ncbi:MAG: hypothetical protein M0R74_13590 [Dehalococcoidia bacterium]|nr:hypothetical protein [Dehalococcoidia bacterium]